MSTSASNVTMIAPWFQLAFMEDACGLSVCPTDNSGLDVAASLFFIILGIVIGVTWGVLVPADDSDGETCIRADGDAN